MEFHEDNQSLIHICQCRDENCKLAGCHRMQQIINHIKNCKIRIKRDCPTCIQLKKICFYHAKYCQNANCIIPLCSRIKRILLNEELKERIAQAKLRRSRLVETLRQPSNQRASKRSPG